MSKNSIIVILIIIIVIVAGVWYFTSSSQQASVANNNAPAHLPKISDFTGTWVSVEAGKGIQATGEFTLGKTTSQITLSGDVQVVIQKIENNVASGTVAYNNVCYTTSTDKQPKCVNISAKPVELQINGDKLTFNGPTSTGGTDSFNGTYADGVVSGTFTREGPYGKLSGTFSMVHQKD